MPSRGRLWRRSRKKNGFEKCALSVVAITSGIFGSSFLISGGVGLAFNRCKVLEVVSVIDVLPGASLTLGVKNIKEPLLWRLRRKCKISAIR